MSHQLHYESAQNPLSMVQFDSGYTRLSSFQISSACSAAHISKKEVNMMTRGGIYNYVEDYGGSPATPNDPMPSSRCPLVKISNMVAREMHGKEDYSEDDECWGEDCGFWSCKHGLCAIAALADRAE